MKIIINSDAKLEDAIEALKTAYSEKKYLIVTVQEGYNRTLAQNALLHKWYAEIADKEYTKRYVEAMCKWQFGIDISSEDPELAELWQGFRERYLYEEAIEYLALADVPVTRNFNRDQMKRYLDQVYNLGIMMGRNMTDPREYERRENE